MNKRHNNDTKNCIASAKIVAIQPWTFYLKASLTDHIDEAHKIKNHKCEECGYTANAGNLKLHLKAVHKKIRNFVCDKCGYAASGKSNLTSHIKRVQQKKIASLP